MQQVIAGSNIFLGGCLVLAASIFISVKLYQVKPDFVTKILKYMLVGAFLFAFSIASVIIGVRIDERHTSSYSRGLKAVQQIWGGWIAQEPPAFYHEELKVEDYTNEKTGEIKQRKLRANINMGMQLQQIRIKIDKSVRQKGLLKFAGFNLNFKGDYVVKNIHNNAKDFHFDFNLPQNAGNITGIKVLLQGKPHVGDTNLADGIQWSGRLKSGEELKFSIEYNAQGTDSFRYSLGQNKLSVQKLDAVLVTDFEDLTVPARAMVPTKEAGDSKLKRISWESENLITGQDIAADFKITGNWGEIAAKLFFYSPLALLLFTSLLLVFNAAREIRLHPMHLLFIMTGFFIFYLFGSYIISYMHVIAGIVLSLALSTGIMLYYASLLKKGAPLIQSLLLGAAMFQWIFSLAFFFPAHTGFLITLAAIVSFIALLKITAAVDWENKW